MPELSSGVAKAIVTINFDGVKSLLLSKKKAKGTPKHGQLEFLGGRIDEETPLEALFRELKEEEKSGVLARALFMQQPQSAEITVDETAHHIFRLSITISEYLELRASRKESLGFKIVPASMLNEPGFQTKLTSKTQEILSVLGSLE